MRIFISILLVISNLICYSQYSSIQTSEDDKYELLLSSKEFSDPKFPDRINSLNKTGQIYEVIVKNDTIIIQNDYLVFTTSNNKMNVKYLEVDDGTYDVEIHRVDGLYYIFKIKIEDRYNYYYFYRKFNWMI